MVGRRVGVDTGGTFTDLVVLREDGSLHIDKTFSTRDAPEGAVLEGVAQLARAESTDVRGFLGSVAKFFHGTTVSTNALIERRGARVGLITTRGFEDTLRIGRGPVRRTGGLGHTAAADFIATDAPEPLVPRHLVRGIGERVTRDGVVAAPRTDDVREAVEALLADGVESIAVCLLWAFRYPDHERFVRDVVAQVAPSVPVSLSSDVAPRMGEFERTTTTVVNAMLGPLTGRYIDSLQGELRERGLPGPVHIMKSSGSAGLPEKVADEAIAVVNSGPVGGLLAARSLARSLGLSNVITADMGGTSFDVGLVVDDDYEWEDTPFLDHGLPVFSPAVRVVTIGAGGGSVARSDGVGLQVGPRSQGSVPGPACYGWGGDEVTVTDALAVLGLLDPDRFFGGRHPLRVDRASEVIEERLAGPLGMSVEKAAAGVYEVVTAKMVDLMRKVTVEAGHHPRDFSIIAYGGASGNHCAQIGADLGVHSVVVPRAASVFSAVGVALAQVALSTTRSRGVGLGDPVAASGEIRDAFTEVERDLAEDLRERGIAPDDLVFEHRLRMRYRGQMNELTVAWHVPRPTPDDVADLARLFAKTYGQRYGLGAVRMQAVPEITDFRVDALVVDPDVATTWRVDQALEADPGPGSRSVYVSSRGRVEVPVRRLVGLAEGEVVEGPAVVEGPGTSIWLPPGTHGVPDARGDLHIAGWAA